jgi:nitrate/TMAO reductase-like tetraheme cytochrome c subunit
MGQKASLLHNRVSWAGGAIALFGAAGIVFFAAFDHFATRSNPYLGIFAWVMFPAIMIAGGALTALGVYRERNRRRATAGDAAGPSLPVVDLNLPAHRRSFLAAIGFLALFVPLSAVGSYHAYEVSESVSFCGAACHTSMSPEHKAFQASTHSAVACVDCHVGPGVAGYTEAKASGVRRMLAAMTNTFHRPIASPLNSLPDASGTCLNCHASTPRRTERLRTFAHFAYDEANTPRQIEMAMHSDGIHAHNSMKVEFAHLDPSFQQVAWVRVTRPDGKVAEYRLDDPKVTKAQADAAPRRTMQCVDCHNRSGHRFETPDAAVNLAMLHGRIDASLPFIKKQAIDALGKPYATQAEGRSTIASDINKFYTTEHKDVATQRKADIDRSIAEIQRLFEGNVFPEMKASWETFPDNIGHFYSQGCFRCHGGSMKDASGKSISKDCTLCHTVAAQTEGKASPRIVGKDFVHPLDLGDLKDATCTDCHTGKGIPQ